MTPSPFLLIGATGPTGLEVLRAAAQAGVPVRALARNPDRSAGLLQAGVDVVQGDVLNPDSLRAALHGTSAVISALGTPLTLKPVTLLSQGTRNLLDAMQKAGVGRLLCITGMGAGDSRGHGGFFYDRVLLPLLLGRVYADKDRQEDLVRRSALDYVLVRPAYLTNDPARRAYRKIEHFSRHDRMGRIARADVAHFLLEELSRPSLHRSTVNLTD